MASVHNFSPMGVYSVKNTVTVSEEGDFTEEGVLFCWRRPLYVEEGFVLILRRGSSSSGVGGSYFAGGGVHFDCEEGVIL